MKREKLINLAIKSKVFELIDERIIRLPRMGEIRFWRATTRDIVQIHHVNEDEFLARFFRLSRDNLTTMRAEFDIQMKTLTIFRNSSRSFSRSSSKAFELFSHGLVHRQ